MLSKIKIKRELASLVSCNFYLIEACQLPQTCTSLKVISTNKTETKCIFPPCPHNLRVINKQTCTTRFVSCLYNCKMLYRVKPYYTEYPQCALGYQPLPQKTPPPSFLPSPPLKFANCPSPPFFQAIPPSILFFLLTPPPPKNQIFQ